MKKITLILHKRDKEKLLKLFAKIGTVHIDNAKEYELTEQPDDMQTKEPILKKISELDQAFSFLQQIAMQENFDNKKEIKQKARKKLVVNLKKENKLVDYDELSFITNQHNEIFRGIDTLNTLKLRLTEINNKIVREKTFIEQIQEYKNFPIPFNLAASTKNTIVFLGVMPNDRAYSLNLPEDAYMESFKGVRLTCVFIIAHKSLESEIQKILSDNEFQKCSYDYHATAVEKINETNKIIEELKSEVKNIKENASEYIASIDKMKQLYDYYLLELSKLNAIAASVSTKSTIIMEGFVPEDREMFTRSHIDEKFPEIYYEVTVPNENDNVPTLMHNSKIVAPFAESITAMYGYPKYGGIDPNPAVAFFFWLFFGFMLGDFGYGIVLSFLVLLFVLIKKTVKGSGSFIKMFGLCGISSMIWGIIFGSYFSIDLSNTQSSFGKFLLSMKLLDPLNKDQTLVMFGLAIGLGVLQVAVGYFMNGYQKVKAGGIKRTLDGVLNDFSWVVAIFGLLLFALNMLVKNNALKIVSFIFIAAGICMLLVGGMLGAKNPLRAVMGAFKNLYGGINVFSDVMSYARLFGLGLTSVVIGMVFNMIGKVIIDMVGPVGYLFAIIIYIIGHLFNFGINALGAYVHDSRLQFVEFFGKFYDGTGRPFVPLSSGTKYSYIKDSLTAMKVKKKDITVC